MKLIDEGEFQICDAPGIRENARVNALAKRVLAAFGFVFRIREDADRLSGRLRRDAGMDELVLERKRIAKAPLIR
jgi:hypothetical protein